MGHYIGIDLGGTNLRAAIADTDTGEIFHLRKRPTLAAEGQEAVIGRIVGLIRELTQANGYAGSIQGVWGGMTEEERRRLARRERRARVRQVRHPGARPRVRETARSR